MKEFVPSQQYLDRLERSQIDYIGKLIVPVTAANHNACRAVLDHYEAVIRDVDIICRDNPVAQKAYEPHRVTFKKALEQSFRRILYAGKPAESTK